VHCLIGRTACDTLDGAADLFAGLQNARIGVTERRLHIAECRCTMRERTDHRLDLRAEIVHRT